MDKALFLEAAPEYYALAIVCYFDDRNRNEATAAEIVGGLRGEWGKSGQDIGHLLNTPPLFYKALDRLTKRGFVRIIDDHFAPTMIVKSGEFRDRLQEAQRDSSSPFGKFVAVGENISWLCDALERIEALVGDLGITDADFVAEEELEWAPLPLDRAEPELAVAVQAVDDVIEEVRSDNGYAATHPEEREYVLDRLLSLGRRLKEGASISVGYIRRNGLDQLRMLAKRFTGAARELMITAAREALKDWLRRKGITFLDDW